MERPVTRAAQAACRCNCLASKATPFFQIVKLIAAIFRARVRRAIVGRIPFPCASGLLCVHAVAITPAGSMELVRSSVSIASGLPRVKVRSAPAIVFSRPAQRSLTLRPAGSRSRQGDPFHRKLRQLCCLRCRFDCFYQVERTSSRAGVAPAEVQRLSRRTVTSTDD